MHIINYSTERNQMKPEKTKFGKFNLEIVVVDDAHIVICNRNLKKSAILGNFGDNGTGSFSAKNREIA
jgi:hypothetical protein